MDSRFIEKKTRKIKIWQISCVILVLITALLIIYMNYQNYEYQIQIMVQEDMKRIEEDIDDLSLYKTLPANLQYSLESISKENNHMIASGWILNPDDIDSNGNVFLLIDNKYFECEIIQRLDVAEYYKDTFYINTGFLCQINISEWEQKEYDIVLCMVNKTQKIIYQVKINEKLMLG